MKWKKGRNQPRVTIGKQIIYLSPALMQMIGNKRYVEIWTTEDLTYFELHFTDTPSKDAYSVIRKPCANYFCTNFATVLYRKWNRKHPVKFEVEGSVVKVWMTEGEQS